MHIASKGFLTINPADAEETLAKLKAAGYEVRHDDPRSGDEFAEHVRKQANERWPVVAVLQCIAEETEVHDLWVDAQKAYLAGCDLASVCASVAAIEGMLRSAMYRVCARRDLATGVTDNELEKKINKLNGLMTVVQKARALQLISADEEKWLIDKVLPLRNPVQHGNAHQLVSKLLGDDFEFPVDAADVGTLDFKPTTVTRRESRWVTSYAARAIFEQAAPQLLELSSRLAACLEERIANMLAKPNRPSW